MAFILTVSSFAYMSQNYNGTGWGVDLGWPLTICHGYRETQEFTHTYPIADGLHNPFAGYGKIHLTACRQLVDYYSFAEDFVIYSLGLVFAGIALMPLRRLRHPNLASSSVDAKVDHT